jgi:hypothetical protein
MKNNFIKTRNGKVNIFITPQQYNDVKKYLEKWNRVSKIERLFISLRAKILFYLGK